MKEVLRAQSNTSEELRIERRRRNLTSNLGLGELALLAVVNPLAMAHEATTLALEPEMYISQEFTPEELVELQRQRTRELAKNKELDLSRSA